MKKTLAAVLAAGALLIGGQTYDNTDIQIQEGSNLDHVYHLIW